MRPACTWHLWGVDGVLVNNKTGQRLPCSGPDAVACVGMNHDDFINLLECGAPAVTPTPAAR